jgi:hypothetical protein
MIGVYKGLAIRRLSSDLHIVKKRFSDPKFPVYLNIVW